MSQINLKYFRWLGQLTFAVAVIWMAYVFRHEISNAFHQTLDLGWIALLILPLFVIWNYTASHGWKKMLAALIPGFAQSVWRLTLNRWLSQAVNNFIPLASVPGEVLKISLVAQKSTPLPPVISAVLLDTVASFCAGIIFTLGGFGLGIYFFSSGFLQSSQLLVGLIVSSALLTILFIFIPQLVRLLPKLFAPLPRSRLKNFLVCFEVDNQALATAWRRCIGWHVVERLLTAGEIWLIAYGLGHALDLPQTLFLAAAMTGASLVFFFIPGQAVAVEGGLSLASVALGFDPVFGLTISLIRRARQLLVGLAGLAFLLFFQRRVLTSLRPRQPSRSSTPVCETSPG